MGIKFDESKTSNQKRLVRGEQLLLARTCLRSRDRKHHQRWKVFTLAGGNPKGEIDCIRELMPQAEITSVDREQEYLTRAIEAGATDVICCDLTDWSPGKWGAFNHGPAKELMGYLNQFDIVSMDLCQGAVEAKRIVQIYRRLVSLGGVFILTFSYGRDVVEGFLSDVAEFEEQSESLGVAARFLSTAHNQEPAAAARQVAWLSNVERMAKGGLRPVMRGRLYHIFSKSDFNDVRSIVLYRGAEMPMCSVLLSAGRPAGRPISVAIIEPGDLELAVTCPDPSLVFDVPQDRIEALRRKHAAIKASYTRSVKAQEAGSIRWSASRFRVRQEELAAIDDADLVRLPDHLKQRLIGKAKELDEAQAAIFEELRKRGAAAPVMVS